MADSIHRSKSGSGVYFGWKPSAPDFRDRKFTAPMALVGLPPKFSLRRDLPAPFSPAWQQGRIGSCGPHAGCRDLLWSMMATEGRTDVKMPSRLFTYFATRSIMGTVGQDSGVDNRSLMQSFAKFGWCDEELWPYDVSKFTKRPPQAAIDQAVTRKISGYLAVAQRLQDMKACIAMNDGFVYGFTVYASWESEGCQRTGHVPMPQPQEKVLGGHDVWMCGFSDETQEFEFFNSHGPQFGDNGYGYMPYALALNPEMSSDFWTIQKSGLPGPIPTPNPTPTPTPIPIPGGLVPIESAVKMSDGSVYQWTTAPTRKGEELPEAEAIIEDVEEPLE